MNKKSSGTESFLSTQTIVLAAVAWAILALMFFLLFSVTLPGQERPEWYGLATYALENIAFLGAGILCLRNWRSPQIVSGRTVWLAIGLGMLSYFIANVLLGYWELGLKQDPDVSPGDFFFILTYLFLGWGMFLAVLSRRLSLSLPQWLIVLAIGLVGSLIAYALLSFAPTDAATAEAPAAIVQQATPSLSGGAATTPPAIAPLAEAKPPLPAWASFVEEKLSPLAQLVTLLYVIGDIILVIVATTLLLAFWGGRFSLSWRFIAAAAFCFYVADTWFSYATTYILDYQTGALPEVFYVFSGVLFAIGAALEYDLSTRSRRSGRRRG